MITSRNLNAEKWQTRQLIVLSKRDNLLNTQIPALMDQRNWDCLQSTSSPSKAFAALSDGTASLLIIDDSDELPAYQSLRLQMSHQVASITPTIVIVAEQNSKDRDFFAAMGSPEIVMKPLAQPDLLAAFDSLINRFSSGKNIHLREAASFLGKKCTQDAFIVLNQMVKCKEVNMVAGLALASFYRNFGRINAAEKILVDILEDHPKHAGILIHLIDLYLNHAAPAKSLELIQRVNQAYRNPVVMVPEAICANLLLNEIEPVINHLESLVTNSYKADLSKDFLSRALYAAGLYDKYEGSLGFRSSKFDQLQKAWHDAPEESPVQRRKKY